MLIVTGASALNSPILQIASGLLYVVNSNIVNAVVGCAANPKLDRSGGARRVGRVLVLLRE
jgi:hypothetical protein